MTRVSVFVIVVVTFAGHAAADDTIFTYQGRLLDGGVPASGSYNMDVSLWDALSDGSQIGSTIMFNGLAVADGLLTVELDFGGSAFDNTARWLEISVNGTELTPRQPITRTPYAIQTRGIFVDATENVGIGTTTPINRLDVDGTIRSSGASGGNLLAENPNNPRAGVSLSWLNDVARLRISGEGPGADNGFDIQRPGNRSIMRISGAGDVGIGIATPQHRLHVESGAGRTIYALNTGTSGINYGVWGQTRSTLGTGVFGWATAASGQNIGVYGQSNSTSGTGVLGVDAGRSGINYGVYGRSDSTSGYDFYAGGAGINYGAGSSRRWKNNIENIDQPLDKIARLRGVYFDWDEEHGGHHDVGMIAEEVGKVLPEIVSFEENGIDAHGMDYSKMTPLLVEAVNALRAEKDAEIDALRSRLDSLERIIERLTTNAAAEVTN